jgi:hypothetical protein
MFNFLFPHVMSFAKLWTGFHTVWSYFESPVKEYIAGMILAYKQWEPTPSQHGVGIAPQGVSQSSGRYVMTLHGIVFASRPGWIKILQKFCDTKFW